MEQWFVPQILVNKMTKGATTILIAITAVIGTIGASLISGYFTAQSNTANLRVEISEVRAETAIVRTTENLHYIELEKRIENGFNRLETLIKNE